ncbi:FliI/YscN family ATPase [Exilibacterium tricleocarpae]|uniref:protein-secreting ATPase n=1 Tax=Exilibacterium tricleocarpae TaxID=2591008 RepID=A0A545U3N2_9GAMM|nr:FliI/YscN family ATPase [Exilibacterium tricleocarpae]TQV84078.1 FliI/YscN family ATPase [Exilibacterium tricleocarpae]
MLNFSGSQKDHTEIRALVHAKVCRWRDQSIKRIAATPVLEQTGRVKEVVGTLVEGHLFGAKIGDMCVLYNGEHYHENDEDNVLAEVVGFTSDNVLLSALGSLDGVSERTNIRALQTPHKITVSTDLFGQVLDGFGRSINGVKQGAFDLEKMSVDAKDAVPVMTEALEPTEKPRIEKPLPTGVRVIDAMLTMGEGQRIGLFAGAGCGKTTLLMSIARGAEVDAVVIGLIGERGRELREFLDHELDEQILKRTVLVCATSDKSSMERSRATFTATAIAEGFRDKGLKVLLLIDSLTRFARAQREIGLAAGEPPAKGGFPPSTYTMLPKIIERAGNSNKGSITALYTVLIEGDSMSDPIADESRSLLDGHIILSRKLGESGHYPAVDVTASLSRTMVNVVDKQHMASAGKVRKYLSIYKELELLIRLGEYKQGEDANSDIAVNLNPQINEFLKQGTQDVTPMQEAVDRLGQIVN